MAGRPKHLADGRLSVLAVNDEALLSEPDEEGAARWGVKGSEQDVKLLVRRLAPTLASEGSVAASVGTTKAYQPAGPREFPPATTSPSSLSGEGRLVECFELGGRIAIRVVGDDAMRNFGEAVHGFLAADRPAYSSEEREAMAEGLLQRWGVAGAVEAADLLVTSNRLATWIEASWPGAHWRREWPVEQKLENGTILRGTADLVLETESGFVLIDHKSFPGDRQQSEARAVEYAGQLSAYAGAIESASGKSLIGSYIHLPVSALMVQVEFSD